MQEEPEEQPKTINPSLLDRSSTAARRKLLFDFKNVSSRSQQLDGSAKLSKGARNNDVLCKAKEMGKKIWPLDKFQMILNVLLESETAEGTHVSKTTTARSQHGSKNAQEPNLLKLLHAERVNGPSDRDPSAVNRELVYFKGPHLYVWDMDEKQKPMMARDYPKVANKADGEWPQFRSVGNGRCPFVEEIEVHEKDRRREREQEKARVARRQQAAVPALNPPENVAPKLVTGKRTLTQMEDGHNKVRGPTPTDVFNPAKAAISKQAELRQNAFTSRAEGGRLFAGEPVASGIQPSNITSAIRSQMISSTSGIGGAKAGTSKEIHGLQRKVLQKAPPGSKDLSSRRFTEVSMDVASSRSTTAPPLSRTTSKAAPTPEEESQHAAVSREKKAQTQPLKSKKDLKPGYCENCQDKFRDFDEVSQAFSVLCQTIKLIYSSTSCLESIGNSQKTTTTGLSSTIYSASSSACPNMRAANRRMTIIGNETFSQQRRAPHSIANHDHLDHCLVLQLYFTPHLLKLTKHICVFISYPLDRHSIDQDTIPLLRLA